MRFYYGIDPLVNSHITNWKITILTTGPFSIAMWNYQRVGAKSWSDYKPRDIKGPPQFHESEIWTCLCVCPRCFWSLYTHGISASGSHGWSVATSGKTDSTWIRNNRTVQTNSNSDWWNQSMKTRNFWFPFLGDLQWTWFFAIEWLAFASVRTTKPRWFTVRLSLSIVFLHFQSHVGIHAQQHSNFRLHNSA